MTGLTGAGLRAETISLNPVADTTLIELAPTNNLGGAPIVNAGTTQNLTRNRGLFRFELKGQVPPGSLIARADFILEVTGDPKDGFNPSAFGLHRLFKPWGEGDKSSPDPVHPGQGALATAGEATWNDRFALTTNAWAAPGGAATNDYAPDPSAEVEVYGIGDSPYTFSSTPDLVADVQAWLDDPASNFGWMLICQAESFNFTARRFASREDPARAPLLIIEYFPPTIDLPGITNGQFAFSFAARSNQAYTVEFLACLSSSDTWSTLTNLPPQPEATHFLFSDPVTNGQRYYRLRLP